MLRPLNNWKKDRIYFSSYPQGEVYRTGIPDEKNSFYHSIQYGPEFIDNKTESDRKALIHRKKNHLSEDINLNTFLKLNDGKVFLEKLKEVMKDVHFHFSKSIEDEDTKLELKIFNINLTLLDILLELVPKATVDEKIIDNFVHICQNKNLEVFNEEQKYKEIQKIYTVAYESVIREHFQILLNENQIEEKHLDKVELFLSLLIKCTYKLFDYICEKTLNEFKEDIKNEWINIYISFYLYQLCDKAYNLLIIDATTKKLFNEIDQKKFIDTDKKCAVVLYFPDYRFEPITVETKDLKQPTFIDYTLNEDVEYNIYKRKDKKFHTIKYFFFNLDHPFIESILNGK